MATFLRLLSFLRPYRSRVAWSAGLAALAMVATVAIPAFMGAAVNAIRADDADRLKLLAILIAVAGVLRLALTVGRRLIAGRVSLGIELDLRDRLYGHLLSLELGFFDRQQTGQLMSRATVDLQAVRFFLGYGLVFIMQSALTLLSRRWRCSSSTRRWRCSRCLPCRSSSGSPSATDAGAARHSRRCSSASPS